VTRPPINAALGITFIRFLCVPAFVTLLVQHRQVWLASHSGAEVSLYRIAALCVFIVAAVSDALDGYVARRFNQQTEVGAWLDPLADKLLLCAAVIMLSLPLGMAQQFPFWFPIVVLTRDTIILLGTVVIFMARGRVKIAPIKSSKWTTFAQMSCVIGALLGLRHSTLGVLLAAAVLLTVVSCVQYVHDGLHLLSEE